MSIIGSWDGYDPRLECVRVTWGELRFRTARSAPFNPTQNVSIERGLFNGWWEPAPNETERTRHWSGDGVISGLPRLGGRTIEIGGLVNARSFNELQAVKDLMGRQRVAKMSVSEGEVSTESDVELIALRWADIPGAPLLSRFTLTLLADDPLRYGSVVPVVVNRVPNPWALPGGVEWGVSAGSGHGTVLSYEPGPPTALRRTFTTSSSAEVYMMPYDSGTSGVWVTAGAWLGVGAWMRRSDGEHVVGTISWRKPDGTFLSWAPFRYAKPLPFEWTWVSLAAQVPEGAGYARPAFGSRSTSVTPGSWFEVTGAVTAVGRLAPGPVGVV